MDIHFILTSRVLLRVVHFFDLSCDHASRVPVMIATLFATLGPWGNQDTSKYPTPPALFA